MVKKLNLKKSNYLLLGGAVGFILSLIVIGCKLYASKMCFDGPGVGACVSELSIIFSSSWSDVFATYGYLIPEFVAFIVVGALIGWICGMKKNRKR